MTPMSMTPTSMTLTAIAVFLILHLLAERVKEPFHVRLKLSRGVAATLLVALGFYALIGWRELWPSAFLARQPSSSPLYLIDRKSVV